MAKVQLRWNSKTTRQDERDSERLPHTGPISQQKATVMSFQQSVLLCCVGEVDPGSAPRSTRGCFDLFLYKIQKVNLP
jgi:hypothetical protein